MYVSLFKELTAGDNSVDNGSTVIWDTAIPKWI